MASPQSVSLAGFAATAVSFGPGRIGFGLFLPKLRDSFALTEAQAGLVTSLAFAAFLAALPVAAWITRKAGQRTPVLLGALSAMAGFILAGSASSVLFLASGVALAGASAGFCWTPFNDAAERVSPPAGQAGVLSAVSTGATMGVALSAALYLAASVADIGWRMSWILFTAMAALALALAGRNIPAGGARSREGAGRVHAAVFLRLELAPLYAAAFCFGAANAIYLAYAALHVVGSGGLPRLPDESAAAVVFLAYGVCGLTGLITGRIEARIGLSPLLAMIFAAFALSLIIIAVTPTAWPAVLASAGLHGAAVMMVSAALSFWSLRAFPGAGTAGFTAALIAVAAGSIAGPALAGVLVDVSDVKTALLASAFAPFAAALTFALTRPDSTEAERR